MTAMRGAPGSTAPLLHGNKDQGRFPALELPASQQACLGTANRNRSIRLDLCRRHLDAPAPVDAPAGILTDQQKRAAERRCPVCQTGTLHIVERLSAEGLLIRSNGVLPVYQIDSS
jgi:hypothetical protein